MAIDYRSGYVSSVAQRTSLVLTIPATCQVDDICLAWIEADTPTCTITPPTGWTLVATDTTGIRGSVYWHRVTSGEPGTSPAFTLSVNDWSQGGIEAYLGVDTTTALDVAASNNGATTGTTLTCLGITTVTNNAWLVGFGINTDVSSTHSSTDFPNERREAISVGAYDVVDATAGATGNKVITQTAAGAWAAVLVALRPAPSLPAGVPQSATPMPFPHPPFRTA